MKKAQIISKVFFYLLVIIVSGIIFLIFFKFITSFQETRENTKLFQFKKQFENDIKVREILIGSIKKFEYEMPVNVEEVCLVDNKKSEEILLSKAIKNYPIMENDLKSNNIFIFSDKTEGFFIENIKVKDFPYFICMKPRNSKLTIYLEGVENGVNIKKKLSICEPIIKDKDTILESFDGLLKLTILANSVVNPPKEICLNIEPSGAAGSDNYYFKPTMTFVNKAILEFEFSKSLGCPQILEFVFMYDDNTMERITSRDIDCSSKIVRFYLDKI